MTKLKLVGILGYDHDHVYEDLKPYYSRNDHILIYLQEKTSREVYINRENGKERIYEKSNDDYFTLLKNRLDFNTRIDLHIHGNNYLGQHFLDLRGDSLSTLSFFQKLNEVSGASPLHVHLWSCYGGLAIEDAYALSEGSLLIIHSSAQHKSINYPAEIHALEEMQKYNYNISPFQSLMNELVSYLASPFSVAVNLGEKIYIVSFDPSLVDIAVNPQVVITKAAIELNHYYSFILEKISHLREEEGRDIAPHIKEEALIFPVINEQDKEKLLISNFISNCALTDISAINQIINLLTKEELLKLINESYAGLTCMSIAIDTKNIDLLKILLNNGANVNNIDEFDDSAPIIRAIRNKAEKVVKMLLEYDADPNLILPTSRYPLFIAASKGNNKIIKMLLEHGANPDIKIEDGATSLIIATIKDNVKIVKMLLKYGANPNVMEEYDLGTPLHVASSRGTKDIVIVLLEYGADPSIQANDGQTALGRAKHFRYPEIVKILENAAKNPKTESNQLNKTEVEEVSLYFAKDYVNKHHGSYFKNECRNGDEAIYAFENEIGNSLLICKHFQLHYDEL